MQNDVMDKLFYEHKNLEKGYKLIAGVDEVGRGPLAGPVVCCAVIMPLDDVIEGVDDSKKLSPKKRQLLSEEIIKKAIALNIYEIEAEEIDRINILQAVRKCMTNAVKGLKVQPDITLVDGVDTKLDIKAEYVIKGDSASYSIGCASIVAKVYRDKLMTDYDEEFKEYCFASNKGYGSKKHIEKIKEIGPCKLHRKTFIKNFWVEQEK